ncbi:MAG TPA: hypothetical protein VLF43_04190 [Candidatus Saccharimonadales bacterium]|nr:hypothetical protein [Candidatus Saccharimonadales bacterium]
MNRTNRAGLATALTLAAGLTLASSQAKAPAESVTYTSIAPKAETDWLACAPPEAMVKSPDRSTIEALGILLVADPEVDYTVPANTEARYRVLTFPDVPNTVEGIAFYRTKPPVYGSSIGVAVLTEEMQQPSTDGMHHVQVPLTDVNRYAVGVAITPRMPDPTYFERYGAGLLPTAASDVYDTTTPTGAATRYNLFDQNILEC